MTQELSHHVSCDKSYLLCREGNVSLRRMKAVGMKIMRDVKVSSLSSLLESGIPKGNTLLCKVAIPDGSRNIPSHILRFGLCIATFIQKKNSVGDPPLVVKPTTSPFQQIKAVSDCHMCQGQKSRFLGNGHPTFHRESLQWVYKPYYWVDDHPVLYGNNGSLDPIALIDGFNTKTLNPSFAKLLC